MAPYGSIWHLWIPIWHHDLPNAYPSMSIAERLFLLSLLLFLGFRLLLSLAERCLQFPHLAKKTGGGTQGNQKKCACRKGNHRNVFEIVWIIWPKAKTVTCGWLVKGTMNQGPRPQAQRRAPAVDALGSVDDWRPFPASVPPSNWRTSAQSDRFTGQLGQSETDHGGF